MAPIAGNRRRKPIVGKVSDSQSALLVRRVYIPVAVSPQFVSSFHHFPGTTQGAETLGGIEEGLLQVVSQKEERDIIHLVEDCRIQVASQKQEWDIIYLED